MMFVFLISAAVTVFLLIAAVVTLLASTDPVEERLMEVATSSTSGRVISSTPLITSVPTSGLGWLAAQIMGFFKPIRGLVSGSDSDLEYKLAQAGFRKPQHVEIFTAVKLLLPLAATVGGTFFGSNMGAAILVGAFGGFFIPDLVLSYLEIGRASCRERVVVVVVGVLC